LRSYHLILYQVLLCKVLDGAKFSVASIHTLH